MRSFDTSKLDKLSAKDAKLFARLKADVLKGEVFPAVRKYELHFYYKGGCLYRFAKGSFKRNPAYDNIETVEIDDYKKAKEQCKIRYSGKGNGFWNGKWQSKKSCYGITSKFLCFAVQQTLTA